MSDSFWQDLLKDSKALDVSYEFKDRHEYSIVTPVALNTNLFVIFYELNEYLYSLPGSCKDTAIPNVILLFTFY